MTHLLPPNLLKLFNARPPLPYLRPVGRSPDKIQPKTVTGVGELLAQIREDMAIADDDEPAFTYVEEVRRQIRREEKQKKRKEAFEKAKESCELYTPNENKDVRGDPYKTLFISRLSKNATESDLRKEFEMYGAIEYLTIVKDKKGRSRGYAFIVYEREKDMKAAYKDAEGVVILGKRILVDVERGRTVRGWKPRRLGGGLGGRPKPAAAVAEPAPFSSGFGGRGGFRGGSRGGFGDRGGGFRGRGGFADRGGGFRGGFGGDRGGGE
ncbi:hypothetical protein BS47DRAFT_1326935 [Hydnum rufescens UP504]|uniref:U1 small nuclear ribonucleoprotein 70 kDa n=1 Tax=Hydnum rufescens UP504 TaxID=1448309 RepID=A0A9P6B4W5_9AGAM|nr:hypothetical protein BS47DRAFT_1326935 [Hydnum rufescens UP504]